MKVKINRVRGGSMGDQRNYGLVTGSIWNYEDKATTNQVKDTLSPIPRDEATIEAEKNETVVWPDKDGNIMHTVVGGKRHSEGGTPLNVPDGSFVFSDTRALNIKNKELLKGVFGYNTNKSVTPAMVAKRYDLNRYFEILNDPNSDYLDKKTAQYMIDNNMTKLGQLALVQEGMKGFPDGVPFISQPLFNKDIAVQSPAQQGPPQAKFGGQIMRRGGKVLPRHQDFGPVGPQQEYNPVVTRAVPNFEKNPSGILPYVNLPEVDVTASTPSNLLDFNEWLANQPGGNLLQGYSKRDILANPEMAEKWQRAVNTNYFDKLFQANPDLKTMLRGNRLKAMQELGPEQFEMLRNSQYGFLTEPGLGSMTLQGLASMSPQNIGLSLATGRGPFGTPMSVAPGLTPEEAGNYNNPLAAISALGIPSRLMQAGADQLLGTGEYGFSDALRGRPSGFGMQADIMMDPTLGLLPGLSKSAQALNLGSRIGEGAASLGRATQALRANPELGYMMSGLPLTAGDYATQGAAWGAGLTGYSTRAIPRFVYGLKGITEETPFILKGQFADEAGQPISGLLNPEGRGYTFAGKTYKAGEYPKTYGFRIPATGKNAGTPSIEQVEIPGLFDDYKGGYTKFREDLQALKKAMDEGKISPDDEIHYDVYGDVPTGDFNFSLVPGNATHKLESNDLFDAYLRLQGFQKQNTGDYKNLISGFYGDNSQFGFTKFGDFLKNAERIPVTEAQMRFPKSEFVSPGRWAWRNTAGRIGMPDFTGIKPFLKHPVTRAIGKGSLYTGIGTGVGLGLYKLNNRNQQGALQDDAVIHTDPRGLVPLDSLETQYFSPDSAMTPAAADAVEAAPVEAAPVNTTPVVNPPVNNAPAAASEYISGNAVKDSIAGLSDAEKISLIKGIAPNLTDAEALESANQIASGNVSAPRLKKKKKSGGSTFIYDPIENTMTESFEFGGQNEGELEKYQTQSQVEYKFDPWDEDWRNAATQYGLEMTEAPYTYYVDANGQIQRIWNKASRLTEQDKTRGYKEVNGQLIPEEGYIGFEEDATARPGYKPYKGDLDMFINYMKQNGVDFNQFKYGNKTGEDAFKAAIAKGSSSPDHQKATEWYMSKVDELNQAEWDKAIQQGLVPAGTAMPQQFTRKDSQGNLVRGYNVMGSENIAGTKFFKVPTKTTPPPGPGPTNPPGGGGSSTTTVKKCECPDYTVDPTGNTKKEVPCNPDGSQPLCDPPKPNWQPGMNIPALWMQGDLYNFYGALGDRPYKSKGPADINANFGRVPYNLEDIARQVAGVQGAGATAMGEMTGVAANPAVLRAMQSGVAGQMGDKIADIMAQNETKNTGIINEAGKVNTEIGMKEQMYNAQNKKDYIAGVATNEQQYANEQLAMDKDVRKAFMQGDTNAMNLASANMREENYKYIPGYGSVFVPGSFTGTGSSNAFDMYSKYKGTIPDTDLLKLIEIERQQKNQLPYNPYRYNPYPGLVG